MNALVRKELRQILPAQILLTSIATVAWFALADPEEVLAPFSDDASSLQALIALFALFLGLLLGFVQFAAEAWQGTHAYLVHRGTGARRAFQAKVFAAWLGFALLIALPPIAFGAYHLSRWDFAGVASAYRLVECVLAGCTIFAGHALGALMALHGRGWWARLALAVLGSLHALLLLGASSLRFEASPSASVLGVLLALTAETCALLWVARGDFERRSALLSAGSRPRAVLHAAISMALFLPIFALAPAVMAQWTRISSLRDLPHLVEDRAGSLYVATSTGRRLEDLGIAASPTGVPARGTEYVLRDEQGRAVPEEQAHSYRLMSSPPGEFATLYFPLIHPLDSTWARPPWTPLRMGAPFTFTGPWLEEERQGQSHWLDLGNGTLWTCPRDQDSNPTSPGGETEWTPQGQLPVDLAVLEPPPSLALHGSLFCDEEGGRFWTLVEEEESRRMSLQPVDFPPGDRFLGFEWLRHQDGARTGLQHNGRGALARGERHAYAWMGTRWVIWEALRIEDREPYLREDEFNAQRAWDLRLAEFDGIGFRLDVHDAKSGALRLSVDYSSSAPGRGVTARVEEAWGLALPPLVAMASWASPSRDTVDPRIVHVGLTDVDMLRGQRRTWIPFALAALAAFLARDLWRRLSRGGAPIELRFLWCGATLFLGLPAYVLCRLSEPRAKRAPRVTAPNLRPLPRFEIRTA